jgi:hypothetical protein
VKLRKLFDIAIFLDPQSEKAQIAIELNSSSAAQLAQEFISSGATTTTKEWLKAGNTLTTKLQRKNTSGLL